MFHPEEEQDSPKAELRTEQVNMDGMVRMEEVRRRERIWDKEKPGFLLSQE